MKSTTIAPSGTPDSILEKISAEVVRAAKEPEFGDLLQVGGGGLVGAEVQAELPDPQPADAEIVLDGLPSPNGLVFDCRKPWLYVAMTRACERLLRIEASYCGDNAGWACNELGRHHMEGRIAPKDEERALAYFARACEGRFQAGCVNLLDSSTISRANPRPLDLRLLLREGGRDVRDRQRPDHQQRDRRQRNGQQRFR